MAVVPGAMAAAVKDRGAEPREGGGWLNDVGRIGRPEVSGQPIMFDVPPAMGLPVADWRHILLRMVTIWLICFSRRSKRSLGHEAVAGAAAAVVTGAELAAVVVGCVNPGAAVVITGAAVVVAGAAVVIVGGSPPVDMMIQFEGWCR